MSYELKDGIKLNPETMLFKKTVYDKTFECKSYQGLINSIESYLKTVDAREAKKEDLVKVYKIGKDKEFLYHPTTKTLYVSTIHNILARVNYNPNKDSFFEDINLAEDIVKLRDEAITKTTNYQAKANGYMKDLKNMKVEIKPYGKQKKEI